ncbi:hypothetical protein [Cellvibrio sp. OA-2007]|uniref:hypothetical protein n=1 Tax=Cellvibrio sp. OA-2007 TaxID=529823 RepID=UPI000781FB1C|nr:hypothetical protein [Cellvibrio sp. OA-2007]
MPNSPCKTLINPDELFGSRDLRLQDRRDSQYLQLVHLCTGFNFSVLQLQRKIFSHLSRKMVPGALEFVLATHDETSNYWYSVTPGLASLKMLNDYVKHYEVDILHMHLFGDDDDDYNQFTDNGFY